MHTSDIVSIPPIDMMRHGMKTDLLLNPEPVLNMLKTDEYYLILIGMNPCITYVQIENSSKGFGVREIKQGAKKAVRSALGYVGKTLTNTVTGTLGGMWMGGWLTGSSSYYDDDDNNNDNTDGTENDFMDGSDSSLTDDNDNDNDDFASIGSNVKDRIEDEMKKEHGVRYHTQASIEDQHRRIDKIVVSPMRRYAALIDSFGRVCILSLKTFAIVRMFKVWRWFFFVVSCFVFFAPFNFFVLFFFFLFCFLFFIFFVVIATTVDHPCKDNQIFFLFFLFVFFGMRC